MLDGALLSDLQRIMSANLGHELAQQKLISQLREPVRSSNFTHHPFPFSDLDILRVDTFFCASN